MPNPPNIPLLRLTALDTAGDGIFQPTTFIHRLGTVGGVGPIGSCRRAGLRLPVYYEADYVFYAAGLPRPEVPTAIAVPEGQNLAHQFFAEGVQIYQCVNGAWAFRAPRADLFDADGELVATHVGGVDAGLPAGPYRQSVRDGSRVHGGAAAQTHTTVTAMKLRLHRAVQRLRACFGEDDRKDPT